MEARQTFVVGDVHGKWRLLLALLHKAKVADAKLQRRTNEAVEVVQIGDLADNGFHADPADDRKAWQLAESGLIDTVIYGNHDRAVVDWNHSFMGFHAPEPEVPSLMNQMERAGRLVMAAARHGYLLTHGGLHPEFAVEHRLARAVAEELCSRPMDDPAIAAISHKVGGRDEQSGILWRRFEDPLAMEWPQIFGHTRGDTVREIAPSPENDGKPSFCIDLSAKTKERLAGIWLPSLEVVEV